MCASRKGLLMEDEVCSRTTVGIWQVMASKYMLAMTIAIIKWDQKSIV